MFSCLGDGNLPKQSALFMTAFATVFGLISACKIYAIHVHFPYAKWIPSGVAFSSGFFNTPSFSLARLTGGIIEHIHRTRFAKGQDDVRIIVMASGFVLGEGVASILCLTLRTLGYRAISCWGCSSGLCAGCP
jgi:uncharacterized oligopeptide transporter (OPT) family protein